MLTSDNLLFLRQLVIVSSLCEMGMDGVREMNLEMGWRFVIRQLKTDLAIMARFCIELVRFGWYLGDIHAHTAQNNCSFGMRDTVYSSDLFDYSLASLMAVSDWVVEIIREDIAARER